MYFKKLVIVLILISLIFLANSNLNEKTAFAVKEESSNLRCMIPSEEQVPIVANALEELSFKIVGNYDEDFVKGLLEYSEKLKEINPGWDTYEDSIKITMLVNALANYGLHCYNERGELVCIYKEPLEREKIIESFYESPEIYEGEIPPGFWDGDYNGFLVDVELPKIDSDDPEEILKFIEENDPLAFEEINYAIKRMEGKGFRNSLFRYCYDCKGYYLKSIAEATRQYYKLNSEGKFKMSKYVDSPLILIARDLSEGIPSHIPPDLWKRGIEETLENIPQMDYNDGLVISKTDAILEDLYHSNYEWGLNNEIHYGLQEDPILSEKLLDISKRAMLNGIDLHDDEFFEKFAIMHYRLKEDFDSEKFASLMEFVFVFYIEVERIQKGLGNYGLKAFNLDMDYIYYDSPEDLAKQFSNTASLLLGFIQELDQRGEKHITLALDNLQYRRSSITPELIEKISLLHQHYGIMGFSRYQKYETDFRIIDHLVRNVEDPTYMVDKPVLVIIASREPTLRFVGGESLKEAFDGDVFQLDTFKESLYSLMEKYNVLIYEVAADGGILDALNAANELTLKQVDALVIAGHGSKETINIASNQITVLDKNFKGRFRYPTTKEERYIDTSDGDIIFDMNQYLSEDAKIFLYSCDTGQDGFQEDNVLMFMANILKGKTVYAPNEKITRGDFIFGDDGKIVGIQYISEDQYGDEYNVDSYSLRVD